MAGPKTKTKTIDTWKKKRWYKLIAPKLFNEQVLGETPAMEAEMLNGRTVAVSMMNLLRDMKKQHFTVVFDIAKIQGEMAYCTVKTIFLNPSSIKRIVRKGKERVDDSLLLITLDGKKIRIKPMLITTKSTNKSTQSELRRKTKEFLTQKVTQLKYEDLLANIVFYKLQKEMKGILNKIYPLQVCEIRSIGVELVKDSYGENTKTLEIKEAPVEEVKAEKKKTDAPKEEKVTKPAVAKEEAEPEEEVAEEKEE